MRGGSRIGYLAACGAMIVISAAFLAASSPLPSDSVVDPGPRTAVDASEPAVEPTYAEGDLDLDDASGDDVAAGIRTDDGESSDDRSDVARGEEALAAQEDARGSSFAAPRARPGAHRVPRAALRARIDALLAGKALTGASVGVVVVAPGDGEILYARAGDEPRIVASNAKLFTVASALRWLGADFRFTTRVHAVGSRRGKVLEGELRIVGDGDPDALGRGARETPGTLLDRVVRIVVESGITEVRGDLVIDDLVFDRERHAPQWRKEQLAFDYAAPIAGFSLGENCLFLEVEAGEAIGRPARVQVFPRCSLFDPLVAVETGTAKSANLIDPQPRPAVAGRLKIRGKTPLGKKAQPILVPLADPCAVHPTVVLEALRRAGIDVRGQARLATEKLAPEVAKETLLGATESPLAFLLEKIGKDSSNPVAEHVFKRAGAARSGRGTFAAGGEATFAALLDLGIEPGSATAVDGSGLSRGNRFSAMQTAKLLAALWNSEHRDLVVSTLPIAGVDGTLRRRLRQPTYAGRARAKTGYINGVSSLSGYAADEAGGVVCFSILFNGFKAGSDVKGVQDAIVKLLCDLEPHTR
jgi:D-alanyl-D-alanine carboxypeptidase/D-alanyl-D-alanine-endopeptidase (penicillin-binding protein 4)